MLSRFARKAITSNVARNFARTQTTKAAPAAQLKIGEASERIFEKEAKYGAHNYSPLPVALARGEGN